MAEKQPLRREVVLRRTPVAVLGGLLVCLVSGGLGFFAFGRSGDDDASAQADDALELTAERRQVVKEEMERHRQPQTGYHVPLWSQPEKASKTFGRAKGIKALTRVVGPLRKADVLKVLEQKMDRIASCYRQGLNARPDIAGKLEYEWTIQRDGRVDDLHKVADTLDAPEVAACVEGLLGSLEFPHPADAVAVRHPIMFQRVPGDGPYRMGRPDADKATIQLIEK